jgi:hypothetical protein
MEKLLQTTRTEFTTGNQDEYLRFKSTTTLINATQEKYYGELRALTESVRE